MSATFCSFPAGYESLGDEAAFLWTTTTAASDREDPRIVEVVAAVGLRALHGLQDGDTVTLEILPDR
ncbi:MAG: hypothetical protein SFV24_17645 [Gemmatimonadales bacterium]|nr:hypothetical protein [Gemmatimonadales bacterium]